MEDLTIWQAIGQLFGNHPVGAALLTGGTILSGVAAIVGTVYGYLKKKPNPLIEVFGEKIGFAITTWGRKKYGKVRW